MTDKKFFDDVTFEDIYKDLEVVEEILLQKLEKRNYLPSNFIQDIYFIWLSMRAYKEFKSGTLDNYLDSLLDEMKNNFPDTEAKR